MISTVAKTFAVALAVTASSADAAAIATDATITTSCLTAINKYRTAAGAMFPVLTAGTGNLTTTTDDQEAKFCTLTGAALAASLKTNNGFFVMGTDNTAITDCTPIVEKIHIDGMAAIATANPPAYAAASVPPFYTVPTNINFVDTMFGKHVIVSGTTAVKCANITCATDKKSMLCELAATPITTTPVWTTAEYDALVAIAPAPSAADVPFASILGLSATAMALLASSAL